MLQFIAEQSQQRTIAEQVKAAIEGGCAWVQISMPNDDDTAIRNTVSEIIPLCREAGTILTIEDHATIAAELGVHGVHLTNAEANARQTRQDLGAEAIIGITVQSAQGVPTLAKLDIDYVTISRELTPTQAKELIETVRSVGCDMPIVLAGDFDALDIANIRAIGASGIATGKKLTNAANPAEATSQLIAALQQ
jgi:thiamine-phosphate pyrophosphorylase